MADEKVDVVTCGKTTIRIPKRAAYLCTCEWKKDANGKSFRKCSWTVVYKDEVVFDGTGPRESEPEPPRSPRHPHFTLLGPVEGCARALERVWKRRVIVPAKLRGTQIKKRTFKGTTINPEKVAEALGLKLGPKLTR